MIIVGDCREVMAGLEPESVDAIVCDPPYGLTQRANTTYMSAFPGRYGEQTGRGGFMGMKWDGAGVELDVATWRAAWRILKPGGHLLAFGGTRTYHRIAVAIEDAGFEIRDCLSWLYGSGFPKSLDVSKAIDKMAGAERDTYEVPRRGGPGGKSDHIGQISADRKSGVGLASDPATPEAAQWAGWGTALKPAWEPVIVARKPLIGTVAANVMQHGTGALAIDACRIGTDTERGNRYNGKAPGGTTAAFQMNDRKAETWDVPEGRWPANVVLDEAAAAMLDAQSGERKSPKPYAKSQAGFRTEYVGGLVKSPELQSQEYGDTGGASRFFYCAKSSRSERNAGLEGMPEQRGPVMSDRCVNCGKGRMDGRRVGPCCDNPEYEPTPARGLVANHHPTVKPIALMRWLVRLVTPPGGTVLDPFAGSGSTGCAAALEGFAFIGIEMDPTYAEIAERRIAYWSAQRPTALQATLPLEGAAD